MGAEKFRQHLRLLMQGSGVNTPGLAQVTGYSRGYLWEIIKGRKRPSGVLVEDLDTALAAHGSLVASWQEEEYAVVQRRQLLGVASAAVVPGLRASVLPLVAGLDAVLVRPGTAGVAPLALAQLRPLIAEARDDFSAVRMTRLAARLPALIKAAQASREACAHAERAAFDTLMAEIYIIGNELAIKFHENALAAVMADRAVQAAYASGDPRVLARAQWRAAIVLRRARHKEPAQQLITDAAETLRASTELETSWDAGFYARMLCCSAYTAATADRRDAAYGFLAHAHEVLSEHGQRTFTRDGVHLYGISVARAVGDYGQAIEFSRKVRVSVLDSKEREVRFLEDTGIAWWGRGNAEETFKTLLAAEAVAPEETRYRPWARKLTLNLYGCRAGTSGLSGLAEFAQRNGITS